MGTFLKFLLFLLILYFLYSWIRKAFAPTRTDARSQSPVRIFKKGEIEKPSIPVEDAETIDFEEIKETDRLER